VLIGYNVDFMINFIIKFFIIWIREDHCGNLLMISCEMVGVRDCGVGEGVSYGEVSGDWILDGLWPFGDYFNYFVIWYFLVECLYISMEFWL
jgi:hypothetical protein